MKRIGTRLVTIAVVISLVALTFSAGGVFAADDEPETVEETEIAPGEQLAGVVGVQDAELDGEVSERTYGIKIANASTDEAKADVVGEQLTDIEERLDAQEAKQAELEAERDAGNISEGAYQGQAATIAAEKGTIERLANQSETTAGELPAELLTERGINVSAIEELRERASELGGPETAEMARSIAGDSVGQSVGADRERGPPADSPVGNASDTDEQEDEADVDDAEEVDETETDLEETEDAETDNGDNGAAQN